MKRPRAYRVVPVLIMTAATAIPVVTAADMVAHAAKAGAGSGLSSTPFATSTPAATATPTATPSQKQSTPASTGASGKPTTTAGTPARATPTPKATSTTTQTFTGPVVYDREGAVQAVITVTGNKITNVSISAPQDSPVSANINAQAVPLLVQETLQAQSANISLVSGATDTSAAYVQSLQAAISQAHL